MLMTARSGRAMIKTCLENLGYDENTYNLDDVYERFLRLADKRVKYMIMIWKLWCF